VVAERYGGELEHWDRPNEPVTADTPLLSWSMAKSVLHALVGVLVADGRLSLDREWRDGITLDHLLAMRDGLDFVEDYVEAGRSDVIEMLFGRGQDDVAAFAADRPSIAPPDERFNYSSGTSNIVSGIVRGVLGDGYEAYLRERLLDPVGMTSARPVFDKAGTWIASSYLYAPAREFAKFGELYLHGGKGLLPDGWVEHGTTARSVDPEDGSLYGAHWWVYEDGPGPAFAALGYDGQMTLVAPGLDLVAVRLGKTPRERDPQRRAWRLRLMQAFA
jgi:CubicO group peptidase (beta-lactamase class C family)